MINKIKDKFLNKLKEQNNEKGMSTIEVIFLIAVLISLAIIFGTGMKSFVKSRLDDLTNDETFDKVNPENVSSRIYFYTSKTALKNGDDLVFDEKNCCIIVGEEV